MSRIMSDLNHGPSLPFAPVVALGCMRLLVILAVCVALGISSDEASALPGNSLHEGQYQKALSYKGPITGDAINYTLYLPPGHNNDKGPYPVIVFLHGAGGGNASSEVMQNYESARKEGVIGDFAVVFPEKYEATVWRDGAKGKRPETNILKELLPFLQKQYNLTANRRQRVIMGFSMGAAGSIFWGAKHLEVFSTSIALDPERGTSITGEESRNYVPQYAKKTQAIRALLKLRLVQGALNTGRFRESLDHLKIPYDFAQLPKNIASYPAGSSCLNRKDPAKKFLHNPACLTAGPWGKDTWAYVEKSTQR